jgi:glycerophosphoryl diester phosphodiesterase
LLKSRGGRPLVIAHRGDSAHAPENTLEAARLGRDAGAEAWELDVQLTRDGVAVVLHDETLTRTTDVASRHPGDPRGMDGFRLTDFDWSEVRELDAGSWFVSEQGGPRSSHDFGTLAALSDDRLDLYRSGKIRVPTLMHALELTAELDWLVNVEIKSFPDNPPGLVEAVLEAIERTGTATRVLLSSFDHRDLARIPELIRLHHQTLRPMPRGALVDTPLARPHSYLTRTVGADTYHLSAQCLGADSVAYRRRPAPESLRGEDLEELRSRGIPVLVYTVNEHQPGGLADHLAALGIDGIFTDDPAGMQSLFGRPCTGHGIRSPSRSTALEEPNANQREGLIDPLQ